MIIIDYQKKNHKKIISACVKALKSGKVIAYPTDTCYGLAVDATNLKAVKKLYGVKGRNFKKPVHIIPPSIVYAKNIVQWNKVAQALFSKFLPGPLTIVLGCRVEGEGYRILSANSGFLGIRFPKNNIALDLARYLRRPITTTSANISGGKDCYSAKDVLEQFRTQKFQPDIIINAGKLKERKPSALVKIEQDQVSILRNGPISEKEIINEIKKLGN